jgi:hypothetical protein
MPVSRPCLATLEFAPERTVQVAALFQQFGIYGGRLLRQLKREPIEPIVLFVADAGMETDEHGDVFAFAAPAFFFESGRDAGVEQRRFAIARFAEQNREFF